MIALRAFQLEAAPSPSLACATDVPASQDGRIARQRGTRDTS